jgi:CubicO group peptidase (beta-lactamase class C family)
MCGSAALAVLMSFQAQAQQPASSTTTQARITRIQNGLLPSVIIKGQPLPAMKLADRMQYYRVPGVSIAFFDHGQIVWAESYGVADVQTGRPVTPETLFQAGSISKPIAALGALRLVESGKLKLDENVNDELTSWKLPENEFTANQKVTLRRILSHSGGVGVHGFGGYELTQPVPSVVQILDGTKPANSPPVRVEAVPGSVWSSSGGGIMIMQLMMMEATGKSFPAQMHDLVLGPIGMSHSTYEEPLPLSLRGSAAHGYEANGDPVPGGFHIYPEMAAAGLWATPSDLALAAIEVQNEYAGTSHKVLSQALAKEMLTHQ